AVVIRAVPMHEWRNCQQNSWLNGVHPRKIDERIALPLRIANVGGLLIGRIWYLEKISARRSGQPQLVLRSRIENQRSESAHPVVVVVQSVLFRRHQTDVAAIRADAGVIRESFGVVADADLAVGGMKTAVSR